MEKHLLRPKALNINRLEYQAKVNLCNALAIVPETLAPSLIKLGKFRNKFVHNLKYEVTEQEQLDFINTIKSNGGIAEQYFFYHQSDFINGFKRSIITLWTLLQIELFDDETSKLEMLSLLICTEIEVAETLTGASYDELMDVCHQRLNEFLNKA